MEVIGEWLEPFCCEMLFDVESFLGIVGLNVENCLRYGLDDSALWKVSSAHLVQLELLEKLSLQSHRAVQVVLALLD